MTYAAKTSCSADPHGTVADKVSGDSTDPSVSGRVPRIDAGVTGEDAMEWFTDAESG